MAISITWGTKVIYVPKADTVLIQASPIEIRELNLNTFRLALKDLEDDEEGMPHLDTHRHVGEITVGALTLARVVEIINGYTVTFEDGNYAVNLVGANSNVGDNVNLNQVSVRSYNAAGLISSPDIEFASYQNAVTVDLTSTYSGTTHPIGTLRQPVNNFADALLIAAYRGLSTFAILGDATVDSSGDYTGIIFIGESLTKSVLTVSTGANVYQAEFYNCTLEGILDGESLVKDSRVGDLEYINGVVERCLLDGTIVLGGSSEAIFIDCWCGSPDSVPVIDMGGSGQALSMRNYSGGVKIKNKSGSECVSVTLIAGEVVLEDTVTGGDIYVCGNGVVKDAAGNVLQSGSWNGATLYLDDLLNVSGLLDGQVVEAGLTVRNALRLMAAAMAGVISGATGGDADETIAIRNAVADAKTRISALVDRYGNRKSINYDLTD